MEGWIKLYRKLVDWEWYDEPNTKIVFIDLLLHANHKERKWRGETIEAGSLVTSIGAIAERNGLSTKQVRTAISHLEKTGEIAKKRTNKNTTLIVLNYKRYQEFDESKGQQKGNQKSNEWRTDDNQTATKGQIEGNQGATNKNVNKVNKERTYLPPISVTPDLSKFSDDERVEKWLDTGLTIAQYLWLSERLNDDVLVGYISKVKQYGVQDDRKFEKIIKWAREDGRLIEGASE
nr:MAG TPA: replisome organizer [Caudoviricetes sp.]